MTFSPNGMNALEVSKASSATPDRKEGGGGIRFLFDPARFRRVGRGPMTVPTAGRGSRDRVVARLSGRHPRSSPQRAQGSVPARGRQEGATGSGALRLQSPSTHRMSR